MEYECTGWGVKSNPDGINVVREYTWSDRSDSYDELRPIMNAQIKGAFFDSDQNAMIFLLVWNEGQQPKYHTGKTYLLMKVAREETGEFAGQIRYHSMKICSEDFQRIRENFHVIYGIDG